MAKEKTKFLLFKLEPNLARMEETILSEKGTKERYIQNLFKENLSKVFDLIYLKEEHCLTNPDTGKKDCRVDTLAFSNKNQCFVVIEYKRGESLELYQQASEYISCLKGNYEETIHNRYELLDILKDKTKAKWGYNDILWKETKAICIATEIDKRLRHHQRPDEQKNENIKIIEIKFYDDKKILYVDTHNLPEWLTVAKNSYKKDLEGKPKTENEKGSPKTITTIDDILNADWPRGEVKDWLTKIRKIFFAKRWLSEEVKEVDCNKYYPIIYYHERISGNKLFSLIVKISQINIQGNWPAKIPPNLAQLCNNYNIKYDDKKRRTAAGDWWFPPLKSSEDFQNLASFFEEYKNNFSEKQKD
ncbi:MAG: hypothetical protein I3273_05615 [Candidatus Moeniiplasma glomeromycotorum]|nr:hypothetical protein [Candidatus Moeniiplasma glomeromycotorum]MCE8168046.1 hypothetical protein [Candidatus Moeniiplasma glomeromycotorum]MCE8169563.1 hypothetical protein [Candidatus Moeniiplasma glomeromycotorum]